MHFLRALVSDDIDNDDIVGGTQNTHLSKNMPCASNIDVNTLQTETNTENLFVLLFTNFLHFCNIMQTPEHKCSCLGYRNSLQFQEVSPLGGEKK